VHEIGCEIRSRDKNLAPKPFFFPNLGNMEGFRLSFTCEELYNWLENKFKNNAIRQKILGKNS